MTLAASGNGRTTDDLLLARPGFVVAAWALWLIALRFFPWAAVFAGMLAVVLSVAQNFRRTADRIICAAAAGLAAGIALGLLIERLL